MTIDDYQDPELEALLARLGKELAPSRASLRTALQPVSIAEPQRSSLLVISTYMSTSMKVGMALVAVLVVAGGGYYLTMPGSHDSEVAMQDQQGSPAPEAAMMKTSAAVATPTAATDSFDDFAASMQSEAQAQQSAVQSTDSSVDSGVSSANNVTSSSQPYDPSSI